MTDAELTALARGMAPVVKDIIARETAPLLARIAVLEQREVPAVRDGRDGLPGVPGQPGERGLSGEKGERGADGVNGKDGTSWDQAFVLAELAALVAATVPQRCPGGHGTARHNDKETGDG